MAHIWWFGAHKYGVQLELFMGITMVISLNRLHKVGYITHVLELYPEFRSQEIWHAGHCSLSKATGFALAKGSLFSDLFILGKFPNFDQVPEQFLLDNHRSWDDLEWIKMWFDILCGWRSTISRLLRLPWRFLTILKAKLGATTTTLLHSVATPGVMRTNPRESHGDKVGICI